MRPTGITWCDRTWSPIEGCSPKSEGCRHCWAARTLIRLQDNPGTPRYWPTHGDYLATHGPHGPRLTGHVRWFPDRLDEPLRARAPKDGNRLRIFVCSRADLFHEGVTDEQRAAVFGVMAAAPEHDFLVLTKRDPRPWFRWVESLGQPSVRIGREAIFHGAPRERIGKVPLWTWPLPNVWLGVSVEDQATWDERVPLLLQCPAALRWVSAEPLLGPIMGGSPGSIQRHVKGGAAEWRRPDWIVIGGESGPKARPCDLAWIRNLLRQCEEAGVAAYTKQIGANAVDSGAPGLGGFPGGSGVVWGTRHRAGADPNEWPEDLRVQDWPEGGGAP